MPLLRLMLLSVLPVPPRTNNLSYGLMLKETRDQVFVPVMDDILGSLKN